MTSVPCKETDCQRKVQARGMCSTHYSYWYRDNNGGRVYATYDKTCAACDSPFTTITKRVVFCSLVCAQLARHIKSADLVRRVRPRVWLGSTIAARKGAALVAGQCAYCPAYFIGITGARYCSERCSTNASWKRRYDRRGEFKVTDKLRLAIYERDANVCQLCNEPVDVTLHYHDPMSATLDHVIPQSHMLLPDHTEGNLRLAHRICNSLRGDRLELEAA